MTDQERAVMQQALEALENGKRVRACEGGTKFQIPLEDNAITALRAALAQQPEPAQEPVAGAVLNAKGRPALVDNGTEDWYCKERNARRLYTTPPQRPPLTDEEIAEVYREWDVGPWANIAEFARAIERKVRGEAE